MKTEVKCIRCIYCNHEGEGEFSCGEKGTSFNGVQATGIRTCDFYSALADEDDPKELGAEREPEPEEIQTKVEKARDGVMKAIEKKRKGRPKKAKAEKTITCDQIPGFLGFGDAPLPKSVESAVIAETVQEVLQELRGAGGEQRKSVRDLEYFPDFTQRPREAPKAVLTDEPVTEAGAAAIRTLEECLRISEEVPQTIALRGYCVSGFTQGETVRQAIASLTLEALTSEFDEAEQAAILMLHRRGKAAA